MPFSPADNEWTIVDPTTTRTNTMDSTTTNMTPTPAAEPKIEVTINTKPKPEEKKDNADCTCGANPPKLDRKDSWDSVHSDDNLFIPPPPRRPRRDNYVRRYSISPVRIRNTVREIPTIMNSSADLLAKLSKPDGVVDMPYPGRGSVYLSTFPFTDKDVKKYSWLFSLGVEDTFLEERGRGRVAEGNDSDSDNDEWLPNVRSVRRGRDRSPYYDSRSNIDIPSVFLSRALDAEVVPEAMPNLRYLIVTQNRHRPAGTKLLVAESRKAAAMLMYYELLKGDSILFVGATVHACKKIVHPKKFKRVETVEEVMKAQEEGFVGVIC